MKVYCNFCGKDFTNTKNMMLSFANKYYVCVYCEQELKELKRLRKKHLFNCEVKNKMEYKKDEQIEKDYTPSVVKVVFKNGFERVYKPVVLRQSFIDKLKEDKFQAYNKKELEKTMSLKKNVYESEKQIDIKHVNNLIKVLKEFKQGMIRNDFNQMIEAVEKFNKDIKDFDTIKGKL